MCDSAGFSDQHEILVGYLEISAVGGRLSVGEFDNLLVRWI